MRFFDSRTDKVVRFATVPVFDALVAPDPADDDIFARVFRAYVKARRDPRGAQPAYRPATVWLVNLANAYRDLIALLTPERNESKAKLFLSNFGSWPHYTGIESTSTVQEAITDPTKAKEFNQSLARTVAWWLNTEGYGRPLSELGYPRHANQCGALVNGTFLGVGSVFNDVYGRMIANLCPPGKPVIAEVGGGYGKLFHFISRRLKDFTYVDLDIPEILACASYYLMKCFPDKNFLLFGEDTFDADALKRYDFVMMPAFCIGDLPDDRVDLFLNKNSFGEMTETSCRHFIAHACRSARKIWHLNHEYLRYDFDDGERSLLNGEYPIEPKFRLLARHMDMGHALAKPEFDIWSDCYWYVYERA